MQYSQSSLKFSFDAQGRIMSQPDECYKLMYAKDDLQSSSLNTNIVKKGRTKATIFLTSPAGNITCSSSIIRLMSCNTMNHRHLPTATEHGKCFPFPSFILVDHQHLCSGLDISAVCTDHQIAGGVEKGNNFFRFFFLTPKNCRFDLTKFIFQICLFC